ncbi:MAG: ornithine carbamoyltransferase [Chlorobi bacterium]|nr:ornithine carbamoyltransferase [Chlorobiota bacterium]
MTKDFLSVLDFSSEELLNTLKLAKEIKANPGDYSDALKGKTLAMIFEKPSLRTRTSFDVGIQQFGGYSLYLSPAEISLGKRESVYDITKVLERMVQGIMIRTFGHHIAVEMAEHANIPIINGLTDYTHPCQAMADFLTIHEIKGDLKGLNVAYIGDGNNVTHSLMFAAARFGVNMTVASPLGFEPNARAVLLAKQEAKKTGAKINIIEDPWEASKNTDVIFTDTWTSMGQEEEAAMRRKVFSKYQVNDAMMANADNDALFLHCLPAHRGEEVTDSVIDSKASVVFQEAENRLHAQKAIMYQLMK